MRYWVCGAGAGPRVGIQEGEAERPGEGGRGWDIRQTEASGAGRKVEWAGGRDGGVIPALGVLSLLEPL